MIYEELKMYYYQNKYPLEDIRKQFLNTYNKSVEFNSKMDITGYKPFVLLDDESEPWCVIFIKDNEEYDNNIKLLNEANKEYYKFNWFYDEVTGLLPYEIVKDVIINEKMDVAQILKLSDLDTSKPITKVECDKGEVFYGGDND